MTRLLSRDEARAFVETLVSVRNAPEACSRTWADKAHMRRNALLYDYVELDDGAVIRFGRPCIEQPPPGFENGGGEGLFSSLNLDALDDRAQRAWERERERAERGRCGPRRTRWKGRAAVMGDFDKRVIKDHKGRVYPTVAAMCRAWGVQKATYLWRMRQGWGLEKSLTAGKCARSGKTWVDPLGNSYDTCADMCRAWGVRSTSTYYRNSRKGGGGERVA